MTGRVLRRLSLRHLWRHPVQSVLSLVSVAIGVAVLIAIDLANQSAVRAFTLSTDAVTGDFTHELSAGPGGVPEEVYRRMRTEFGSLRTSPVVEGYAQVPSAPGLTLHILGIDPFSRGPSGGAPWSGGPVLKEWFTLPGAALVSATLASKQHLRVHDDWSVSVSGEARTLHIIGLLPGSVLDDLALVDVASAQELLHAEGNLSHIDVRIEGDGENERRALAQVWGSQLTLESKASKGTALLQMTRAFRINLQAMSLLALMVGMFLVYNTMTFAVVKRRSVLGTLRAMGLSRGEVFRLILTEAIWMAIPATLLGMGLGFLLGRGLLQLVTRTINDLYFVVQVKDVHVSPGSLLQGAFLGLLATTSAALLPAWEATRIAPALSLRTSREPARLAHHAGHLALAGAGVCVLALACLLGSGKSLVWGYLGLFALLLAAALLVPFATRCASLLLAPLAYRCFGWIGRLAARGLRASLGRVSVALCALMIALATTLGVGIMIDSFRETVVQWLGESLRSDIFVQPPNLVARKGDGTLLPEVVDIVQHTQGVRAINTIRNRRLRTSEGEVDLHVPTYGEAGPSDTRFHGGEHVLDRLASDDCLAVSVPYAFHHDTVVGGSLSVLTDHGTLPFRIVATYDDYASDEGGLLMSRATYERHFDDRLVSALGVVADGHTALDTIVDRIRSRVGGRQAVILRQNAELRRASLAIFDRTFAITEVLRLLSVVVAWIGILSALMALALERAREMSVLRAMGLSPRQVWQFISLQTAMLGLCAGLFALPLGVVLAKVLVDVINRRSFGWSMPLHISTWPLVATVLFSVTTALLAGVYPAYKMSRAHPARALREDG